jgi:hypothetical protein
LNESNVVFLTNGGGEMASNILVPFTMRETIGKTDSDHLDHTEKKEERKVRRQEG